MFLMLFPIYFIKKTSLNGFGSIGGGPLCYIQSGKFVLLKIGDVMLLRLFPISFIKTFTKYQNKIYIDAFLGATVEHPY